MDSQSRKRASCSSTAPGDFESFDSVQDAASETLGRDPTFADKVLGSEADRCGGILLPPGSGDHNDREGQRTIAGLQLAQKIQAGQTRHINIQQHAIQGPSGLITGHRLFGILDLQERVVTIGTLQQQTPELFTILRVIIHDKKSYGMLFHRALNRRQPRERVVAWPN